MQSLRRLVHEIHRRSLWQVMSIYLLGGWAALQVVDTLGGALNLPDWAPSLALVLLIVGLPIVMATAFVQEGVGRNAADRTAEGPEQMAGTANAPATATAPLAPASPRAKQGPLPRQGEALAHQPAAPGASPAVDPSEIAPAPAQTATPHVVPAPHALMFTWRNTLLGGVAATVLWGVLAVGWVLLGDSQSEGGSNADASIAVLPFANRSHDPDSEFFVDGMHDDVLTQLSKIGTLRVISRTSVVRYRGTDRSVPEIARELGVSAILEGGIERSGEQVRITMQLIDARNDRHLWAETYDEALSAANVFQIRSDVAKKIATALHATLTPDEVRRIERPATQSLAAYDLVLRGQELYQGGAGDVEKALELFRQATRLAPDYADAHAWLANAYAQRVQKGGAGEVMADSAIAAARHAIALDPELPEGHKALGLGLGLKGLNRSAQDAYRKALELSPNWHVAMTNLSATAYWFGQCDEGIRFSQRARAVAPDDPFPPGHMALHYGCLDQQQEADRWIELARSISPDWYWIPVFQGLILRQRGDSARTDSVAQVVLARDANDPFGAWLAASAALDRRDYAAVERWLAQLHRQSPDWAFRGNYIDVRTALALARRELGRPAGTDALIEEAVTLATGALQQGRDDPTYFQHLAAARALQGRHDDALAALQRGVDAGLLEWKTLDRDPRFEALRHDARFQSLLDQMRARIGRMAASLL